MPETLGKHAHAASAICRCAFAAGHVELLLFRGSTDGSPIAEQYGFKVAGEACVWCGGVPEAQDFKHCLSTLAS